MPDDEIVFDMSELSDDQQDVNADWIKPRNQTDGGKFEDTNNAS